MDPYKGARKNQDEITCLYGGGGEAKICIKATSKQQNMSPVMVTSLDQGVNTAEVA